MDSVDLSFTDIMERVALVMETELGVIPYDKNIANELGMSPTQFANNKKRNKIPFYELTNFCYRHEITINWVLLGKSSMKLIEREEEVFKIRLIERINGSCGGGGFDDEAVEEKFMYIDKESAKKLGITSSKNIEAIRTFGDSMEPTIKDGATVLIDRTKNTLDASGVYVVNTTSGLFVKRLSANPHGGIDLISDNKIYDTITMSPDEISIIGKVIGSLEKV